MAGLGGWESVYNWALKIFGQAWRKDPPENKFLTSQWVSQEYKDRVAARANGDDTADTSKEEL